MKIIPKINGKTEIRKEFLELPKALALEAGDFCADCVKAFGERTGIEFSGGEIKLSLSKDSSLADEEYKLSVKRSGIDVKASTERGVIWALTTLCELLNGGKSAPICEIEDKPKYRHRGQHLDCSRHFFTVEEVKRVIEQISLVKMNVLHWHISDDQGWRIECKKHPLLHEKSVDYYTQDEMRDAVEYARVRGVEIIPEIDMPGHTTAMISAYPELSCSGEDAEIPKNGGIFNRILCAGKESTFELIEDILDEVCPIFISPRFHIGGDEAPKREWKACPECQKRMKDEGLANEEDLQGYFTARVAEMLKKHGKTPICWDDSLLASNFPKDAQVQYWTFTHAKETRSFAENGGEFIYSDMFEIYFDYPYLMSPLKKAYCFKPQLCDKPWSKGLIGVECCLWAEQFGTNEELEQRIFPRSWAVAEVAWTEKLDYRDFLRRLEPKCEEARRIGISVKPKESWNPKGKLRKAQLETFISVMSGAFDSTEMQDAKENANIDDTYMKHFVKKFFKLSDLPTLAKLLKKLK